MYEKPVTFLERLKVEIMKVKMKRRMLAAVACACAISFVCQTSISYADNLDDLEGQSSELESELSSINQELVNIGTQIAENELAMETIEGKIVQIEEQLAIAKENEKEQYEDMKVRIQYIYENDDTTLLSMILSAESLTDFVNKIDFVTTLNDYDRDMLDKLVDLRETIESEESQLKEQKESYTSLEEELNEKKTELNEKAASTSTDLAALSAKIQQIKDEEAKKAAEALEKAAQEQEKSQSSSDDSSKDGGTSSGNKGDSSKPSYNYPSGSGKLTPQKGVVYYNGHRETYYSQRVLPGTGLKIPGRHVASDGTIRDADGYIVLAADWSEYPKGTIVQTSLGAGKVYDTGCAKGTIDLYTDW